MTIAVHTGILGALLTFARRPLYTWYSERAAMHGTTALDDQQFAGVLMWVPGGVLFTLVGIGVFAAWLGEAHHRTQVNDAHRSQG